MRLSCFAGWGRAGRYDDMLGSGPESFGVQTGLPRLASVRMRPHQFDFHLIAGNAETCDAVTRAPSTTLDTPLTRGPGAARVRRIRPVACAS